MDAAVLGGGADRHGQGCGVDSLVGCGVQRWARWLRLYGMDEITDIGSEPRGAGEEAAAGAFCALLAGGRPLGATSAALADVTDRARRRHRRRLAGGGALSVAAVGALVLGGPAVLGAGGLLAERGASVSGPSSPSPTVDSGPHQSGEPDPSGWGRPLLNLPMVDLALSDAQPPGSADDPPDAGTMAVGGFCGNTALAGTTAPTQVWWAATPDRGQGGALPSGVDRVEERVLRWGDDDQAGAHVSDYVRAMTDAPTACTGAQGTWEWEQVIPNEPVAGPVSGAVMAPDATRTTWRYKVVAPSQDGRAVVDLTVDVQAPDAPSAIAAVDPLLVAAAQRASIASLQHSPDDPTFWPEFSIGGRP